ncbi:hypothetical protein [Dactylosporangium sp. NPDC005555]|uniref:hypothetical protein n=1 Tax=Dactylosporangium sp. NPDC005555 TaxID=3154889 RepID=UPI0033ADDD06
MLLSGSTEESHLYMDLQPRPGCGFDGFEWDSHSTQVRGEDPVSVCQGSCPDCGTAREFEFVRIGQEPPPPALGGPEPSRLIDPGQFLSLAREAAALVPASPALCPPDQIADAREAIAVAVAAMDEVGKFVPAGADAVPVEAFTSEAGRALYGADPTQFRRRRVDAVTASYREVLTAYQVARGGFDQ